MKSAQYDQHRVYRAAFGEGGARKSVTRIVQTDSSLFRLPAEGGHDGAPPGQLPAAM
ncbi:MAG: hypothetical protein JXQ27_09805 [Acidobacteria bacterium]|nr:hypothetical protein [Acidobacteriota bacterium]